jgi:hypothetical protein
MVATSTTAGCKCCWHTRSWPPPAEKGWRAMQIASGCLQNFWELYAIHTPLGKGQWCQEAWQTSGSCGFPSGGAAGRSTEQRDVPLQRTWSRSAQGTHRTRKPQGLTGLLALAESQLHQYPLHGTKPAFITYSLQHFIFVQDHSILVSYVTVEGVQWVCMLS